jgi:nitrile hydratase accessory protein
VAAGVPLPSGCIAFTEDDDVSFAEPWEARAFAIVLKMSAAGHFTWAEWVDCFSREVAAATEAAAAGRSAPTYYEQWLAAAEKILILKGQASRDQLLARRFAIASAGPAHLLK